MKKREFLFPALLLMSSFPLISGTVTTNHFSKKTTETTSNSTAQSNQTSTYNTPYTDVLPLALKFYEAQRATGPFPSVDWRKAGGLSDGEDVGRDLTGGWFDAGDHVKFNLPMSYSTTMLNWGMLNFSNAYVQTNTLEYGKDQVKYALDYLLNAYDEGADPTSPSDDKVHYQVGDGDADHAFWGPPELMTMDRPTFTCDATNKCSEVAGEMAAAFASGAMLFTDDPTYATTLLDKAKKIYAFAETYQGNNGYTAPDGFYTSHSGYNDELAWGAIWLYKATQETSYLEKAKEYLQNASDARYWAQNWDNVTNGVNLLLAEITGEESYQDAIETHLNYWLNGITYTGGGLAFLNEWGSLRYASTTSFMALLYAQSLPEGEAKSNYINFAQSQIDYILGDNPRESSYVVGYGVNPPINPHHRASHNSQTNDIQSPTDNEFTLEGALVGGPKSADDFDYADERTDYIANEVATDYNAGFTGALAGLILLGDTI